MQAARSGWLNRSAVEFGFKPDAAIKAFTEVLKAGIPDVVAKDVTRSIMGASAGLDLNVPDTTKLVGRLATLTQDPKNFDGGAIDRMLNGIAVVAKVTAADSKELVSSLRRGAGVLGSSKMSVQDLTAFTGVGISAGMQEGKAGTFMDFLVNDMVNAKHARGQRGKDLDEGFRLLGIGSRGSVSHQAAQDPTTLLMKTFERLHKMNPEKAGHVASLIGMREWRGEMLQMAKAAPMLRQTVDAERDPKNAGHLKQASDEKLGTLAGLRSQLTATFDLAWEAVGGGIEDIVREIGTFFIDLGKGMDFDVIKAHVHTLVDGFIDGLGFKNVTEMLEAAFGKAGKMDYSTLQGFFDFAQGFGKGVRDVVDTIKAVVTAFTGPGMDAEALGKLTAKVLGFGFVLAFISPFVGVLAGLGGALVGFGFAVSRIATALRAAGLLGGAGAAAGAAGAAGAKGGMLGALGKAFGVLGLAEAAESYGALKMPDAGGGLKRGILEALDPGLADWMLGKKPEKDKPASGWQDPPAHTGTPDPVAEWRRLMKEGTVPWSAGRDGPAHPLDRLDDEPAPKPKRKRTSARKERRERIEPAAFTADTAGSVDRLNDSIRGMGATLQRAALSGMGETVKKISTVRRSFGEGTNVVASGGSLPPGVSTVVPGWYGRSRGAGGGRSGAVGVGASDHSPIGAYRGAQTFAGLAPRISADLGKDFGLSKTDTSAILGNLGHESAGMTAFQEGRPRGGRGGWGWAQWTGPRRRAFEAFASARGLDPKSYEANYGFLRHELQTSHRGSLDALRNASGLEGKTVAFEKSFEGAAADAKHYGSRIRYARAAAGMADGQAGVAGPGAGIADSIRGAIGDVSGLRIKSREATAGGASDAGTTDLARVLQGSDIAGGLNRFTALNDAFHHRANPRSKHTQGLAFDFTLNDASKSAQAVEQVRDRLRAAGLDDSLFKVIDEYKSPSGHATGGHIHTQFNTHDAAARFAETMRNRALAAGKAMDATVTAAKRAQDGGMERLAAPKDEKTGGTDPGFTSTGWHKPTTDEIVTAQPPGINGRGGGGSGGRQPANGGPVSITVHGAGERPEELAAKVQRTITAGWNHRGHDLEPELV